MRLAGITFIAIGALTVVYLICCMASWGFFGVMIYPDTDSFSRSFCVGVIFYLLTHLIFVGGLCLSAVKYPLS